MHRSLKIIALMFLIVHLTLIEDATALARPGYRPLLTDKDKGHFGREMAAKYDLLLVGCGGGPGIGPNGVKHVSFTFSTKHPRPIAVARKLCIAVAEDLLEIIHKAQVRVGEEPANIKAIVLSIDFANLWGKTPALKSRNDDVTYACLNEGVLSYFMSEAGDIIPLEEELASIRSEKYEDALKIVEQERSSGSHTQSVISLQSSRNP